MMPELPFFNFWPGDYLADTPHLTTEQHGAYLLLLMAQWRADNCRLLDDAARLCRIAKVPTRRAAVLDDVLEFFTREDGFVFQKRLRQEWADALQKRTVNSANGAAGGRAKSLKSMKRGVANATNSPKRNATSHNHNQNQISPSSNEDGEGAQELEGLLLAVLPPTKRGTGKKPTAPIRPDLTITADMRRAAIDRGVAPPDVDAVFRDFKDYWIGRGEARADWPACFRTWCSKQVSYRGRAPVRRAASDQLFEAAQEIFEKMEED